MMRFLLHSFQLQMSTMKAFGDHEGFISDKFCKASVSDAVSSFTITIVASTV